MVQVYTQRERFERSTPSGVVSKRCGAHVVYHERRTEMVYGSVDYNFYGCVHVSICVICSGNGMVGHTTDLLTISTLFLILQLSVSASGRAVICSLNAHLSKRHFCVDFIHCRGTLCIRNQLTIHDLSINEARSPSKSRTKDIALI